MKKPQNVSNSEKLIKKGAWLSFPKGLKMFAGNHKDPLVAVMVEITDEYPDTPYGLQVFTPKGKSVGFAYFDGKNPVIVDTPDFAKHFKVVSTPRIEVEVSNSVAVFDTKNKVIYDASETTRISSKRKELLQVLNKLEKLNEVSTSK